MVIAEPQMRATRATVVVIAILAALTYRSAIVMVSRTTVSRTDYSISVGQLKFPSNLPLICVQLTQTIILR